MTDYYTAKTGNVALSDPTCGCCDGIQPITPRVIANRPGLNALSYRVGTHAAFLETMKARLSNFYLDIPLDELDDEGQPRTTRVYPLQGLTTRAADDASIALLDAWATVGDVLTFYQQRIANEGYLCTATERRSILELARLVGYTLRPGVSASTYLAYMLEKNKDVTILQGSRAQSLPGPGELPQSFETSQDLAARSVWNNLKPRLNKPQTKDSIHNLLNPDDGPRVYLSGVSTNLKPNDPLLIDFGDTSGPELFRVKVVEPEAVANRTKVALQAWSTTAQTKQAAALAKKPTSRKARTSSLQALAAGLSKSASLSLSDLEDLVNHFAAALMTDFTILAKTRPSPDRDAAIDDTRSALNDLLDALNQIPGPIGDIPPVLDYVAAIKDWIKRALDILDAATVGPPPPTQAERVDNLINHLLAPAPLATLAPRSAPDLTLNLKDHFVAGSDAVLQVVTKMQPALESVFYAAYRNLAYAPPVKSSSGEGAVALLAATGTSTPKVYALRITASLFGSHAPRLPTIANGAVQLWPWDPWSIAGDEDQTVVFLDNAYDKIQSGAESYIVLQNPNGTTVFTNTKDTETFKDIKATVMSRAAYGIAGKTTRITLPGNWRIAPPASDPIDATTQTNTWEKILRGTVVYTQSEELALALEPITDTIPKLAASPCIQDPLESPFSKKTIELAELYDGLKVGQWLIVSGERADICDVTGVRGTELVMLARTEQIDAAGPGDNTHSLLTFANDLRYVYKRETVVVYGNVVPATHGETRSEILGSGDGGKPLQRFALRQSPLTYLAAPTAAGAESTLKVYVNDVRWHESDSLAGLQPTDRRFITRTDDDDKSSVIFGNGQQGARLPTGVENVRAVYRTGIGKPGNAKAEQISLLVTRPLGVKSVINPLAASGGADRESRDQARRNAPLAVMALDRLISVQDYADFTRTFAGIGKAAAAHLSNGQRQLVHITIAGADDISIDENSDLYNNLLQALRSSGDPYQPFKVDPRELKLLVIKAKVSINADYIWEKVEPQIRAALLDTFSFERRELGQSAFLSEVLAAIQAVPGVIYVDVDTFGYIPEKTTDNGKRRGLTPDEIAEHIKKLVDQSEATGKPEPYVKVELADFDQGTLRPAELAFLSPELPTTLVLNRI